MKRKDENEMSFPGSNKAEYDFPPFPLKIEEKQEDKNAIDGIDIADQELDVGMSMHGSRKPKRCIYTVDTSRLHRFDPDNSDVIDQSHTESVEPI